MRRGVVLAGGIAVVAVISAMLWRGRGAGETANEPTDRETAVPVPIVAAPGDAAVAALRPEAFPAVSVLSVDAPVPVAKATVTDRSTWLELPDGTFVPALNGATGALSLRECWGTRPCSPIERVERSDVGVDWYVHQDGTRTTTEMKWRSDLGRQDALTRIAVPLPEAPPTRAGR